jgi:hypothetical protein
MQEKMTTHCVSGQLLDELKKQGCYVNSKEKEDLTALDFIHIVYTKNLTLLCFILYL